MVGVAERLVLKDNELQIVHKKSENVEEEMFFPSTLGPKESHPSGTGALQW